MAGAAVYLALHDKLTSADIVIIFSVLGGGVTAPWMVSRLLGKKPDDEK